MDLMILTFIKFAIIIVAIIIGLFRHATLNEANRIFWLFLFVALAGEILDPLLARYFRNNFPIYHVFRPLYYTFLTLAISNEMKRLKTIYIISIPLVIIAAFLNAKFMQPPDLALNTIIINLISVLLILQVLFYIAILFEEHSWEETMHYHSFWIAIAILIHSIASFLSLGIHNFLDDEGQDVVVNVQAFSEFIFYGSFSLNFMLQKTKPVSLNSAT
jgi:hypothetical protein